MHLIACYEPTVNGWKINQKPIYRLWNKLLYVNVFQLERESTDLIWARSEPDLWPSDSKRQ